MSDQQTPAFDVLVIGELNMDLILDQVESFPELGKEKIASGLNITLGSSSAIFASNIARLGMQTAFCGLTGNDDFGHAIKQELQQKKVNTQWVKLDEQYQTGLTAIIREGDDRAMITYPGAMAQFSLQDIPDETFRNARHLHISSLFLQPVIKKELYQIIDKAKAHRMTISIDPQWDSKERWDLDLNKLLPQIDFFMPNEAEFLQLSAGSSVEKELQNMRDINSKGTVIVKRERKGAAILNNGRIHNIPAYLNKNVADAVGAGDSFNAGFIYRYLKGDPMEQCLRFAAITGAVSTTKPGGTQAIQSLEEVIKIAKNKLSIPRLNEFTE